MVQVDVFWSYGLASGLAMAGRFTHTGSSADFGVGEPLPFSAFIGSPVFNTLLAMGLILVSTYAWLCLRLRREK